MRWGQKVDLANYLAAEGGYFAANHAVRPLAGFGYALQCQLQRYFREARLPCIAAVMENLVAARMPSTCRDFRERTREDADVPWYVGRTRSRPPAVIMADRSTSLRA
jgi:hypothetical protein